MFKTLRGKMYSSFSSSALFCSYVSCWIVDFQKLDHFWILWIKPNPQIVSQMLNHALFFHNLSRQIFCEIFVKIENTEYLSNQLTYANFDLAMMFPIKNWTFEQILVFSISEMYLPCPIPTVNKWTWKFNYQDFLKFCGKLHINSSNPTRVKHFGNRKN